MALGEKRKNEKLEEALNSSQNRPCWFHNHSFYRFPPPILTHQLLSQCEENKGYFEKGWARIRDLGRIALRV